MSVQVKSRRYSPAPRLWTTSRRDSSRTGTSVGFPDETGLDDGPVPGRIEAVEGGQADAVAEGRAVVPGGGFDAGVEAVVEAEVPLPSFGADRVGEPERAVVGIGLGLLDEHVLAARGPQGPVMDHVEIRAILEDEGLAAADEDREPARGVVPR